MVNGWTERNMNWFVDGLATLVAVLVLCAVALGRKR